MRFAVVPSDFDEDSLELSDPVELARALAREKARAVAARGSIANDCWVLAADTVVAAPALEEGGAERLLAKPADEEEARGMLRALSNSRHRVVTGLCALGPADSSGREERGDAETTWVRMRSIGEDEIDAYVRSGEWRDKAGGYAIQETADQFVLGLEGGGFDNVVGLPVRRTLELLSALGWRAEGGSSKG